MKHEIIITKERRVWQWQVILGGEILFGGYCRTKKAATSDAETVVKWHDYLKAL